MGCAASAPALAAFDERQRKGIPLRVEYPSGLGFTAATTGRAVEDAAVNTFMMRVDNDGPLVSVMLKRAASMASYEAFAEAASEDDGGANDEEYEEFMRRLPKGAGTPIDVIINGERVEGRIASAPRYEAGERLYLLLTPDQVVDATVVAPVNDASRHSVSIAGTGKNAAVDLNDFNHSVQLFESVSAYAAARTGYLQRTIDRLAKMEDAITGNKLNIDDQMIMITVLADKKKNKDGQVSSWSSISNMEDLTNLLVTPSPNRTHGTHESQGVLIRAGPGTGKTVSLQQLTRLVCLRVQGATEPGVALVPMLLTVQRLASYIKKGVLEITSPDLLRAFIDIEYTGDDRNVLVQAYDMRALVCAIDGVDEAAGLKNKIEDLVINKLAPMGIRTVASSRPEGVRVERYAKFVTMDLAPLSEEQQRKAIAFQLKNSKEYDHLVILSKLRKERRASTPSTSPSDAEVLSALQSNAGESYDKIVAVVKAATPSKDPQIEFIRILDFFDLASTVPVMLSMLVLCLEDIATNKTGDPIPLPTSRLDLYTTAARASIRRLFPDDAVRAALATQMLARISVENHLAQRREYTSVDVATILGKFPEELALWHELESTTEGVPLVKILEVGSSGSPSEGQTEEELSKYQFKHLSFQEAFFAEGLMFQKDSSRALLSETLASEAQLVWKRGALRVLNDRWMLNSFTICGPALGPVVAGQLGQVADLHLTEHHVKVMAALAWEPLRGQSKLTSLALQVGFGIDFTNRSSPGVAHLEAILADLKEMPNLTKIDFGKPTNIGVGAAACICAAVEKRKGLRMYGSVSAGQFSGIGDADAVLIAATLRNCNGLTMDVSSATIATPSDGFPYIKLGSGSLAEALKSAGATAASFPKELANHLMFAGFTAADMSAAKYLSAELAEIGFAAWDILQTIGNGDPTPAALKELTACGLAMEIVCGGPNKVPLEDLVSAQCPGVPDVDKMDDACDTASNMPNYRSMKDASGVMDASKEGINDKNGAFLVWAVAVNCHNAVTELNFSRNQMGPLTCQALAQLLRFNKSITTLDLHSNGIDDAGAASLAKALSWNNTVSMIRLSMNNITNPGAVKIFEGLADNFSLEGIVMETSGQIVVTNGIPIPVLKGLKANELIDLSGRKFGPLSAAIIARLISTYRPVLTELGIDRNPIRSEGAAEIAEMLKTNNDIKELDIRFCGMGTEGTKHIAAALQVNTSVERVLMLQNQAGNEGVQYLIEMLKINKTLNSLAVQDNLFNPASKAALAEACAKRGGIKLSLQ